ncbi:MAG: glycosyltransferase [Desulfovibrio sp.]|nr:glycosyltransferase [Desulfovibrio sp.]
MQGGIDAVTLRSLLRFVWYRLPVPQRSRVAVELFRFLLRMYCAAAARDSADTRCADGGKATGPASAPCWVVGFFTAATGLGQGARLFYREMKAKGVVVHAVDVTFMLPVTPEPSLFTEATPPSAAFAAGKGAGSIVIHANPSAYMVILWFARRLMPGKRLVAYWAWEWEEIPHFWTRCLAFADEIYVPSAFTADAVRRKTDKPVTVHPHAALPVLPGRACDRPFTVLFCFDCTGNFYRKNPLAVVAAFKKAFGDSPEARLLLKVTDAHRCPEAFGLLTDAADAPNMRFCLGHLTEQGMADLYAEADVYLSLHRAEGYGLTIQEALLHGLPVIATGWSGNMDIMRDEHRQAQCMPVPYTLIPVDDPLGNYTVPGCLWAEPDTDAAADMLRLTASEVRGKAHP